MKGVECSCSSVDVVAVVGVAIGFGTVIAGVGAVDLSAITMTTMTTMTTIMAVIAITIAAKV